MLCAAGCGSVEGSEDPPSVEPPVNTSTSGTVPEGGTLSLASHLVSTDADSPATDLLYTLVSVPGDGMLKLSGTPLAAGDTFTQKQVTDGDVSYEHGGNPDGGDSFDWQLTDGTNMIATTTFAITVTPTNDAPAIVNNPETTVPEGGMEVLTPERFSVSDEEGNAITFTFVSAQRGTVERRVGAAPFTTMVAGDTFTVQDVADGNIRFVDPGDDDAMLAMQQNTTASFSWRMTDSEGAVAPSATGAFVTNFIIESVDDLPTVTWKTQRCQASGTSVPASPIMAFSDPDNVLADYELCVVAILNGESVTPSSTTMPGVTTTVVPVLQLGATNKVAGDCVPATQHNSLNLDSAANSYRGGVRYQLKKAGVNVLTEQTVGFPVTPTSC
jgi:hypothetical protein